MAQFISNFDLDGTLRNQTYYKLRGKVFAKAKSGVSRERILTDEQFIRTRENGHEFGAAAKAGKLLRNAFAPLLKNTADALVTARLTQVMTKVKNEDTQSERGDRSVAIGITSPEGKALLTDFNFNRNAILTTVLSRPYTLDVATGIITIAGFVPVTDIAIPEGATNIMFTGALGTVDFETGAFKVDYTNEVNVPYNNKPVDVILTPDALPGGTGTMFYLLHITFFQQVNRAQYALSNSGYNSLAIIAVE